MPDLWLVRHGETAWTLSGAHTGRSDIPLTENGREQARAVARLLVGQTFSAVFTSPRSRARETCRLAGLGDGARVLEDLAEWDYGDFEGKTSAEIHKIYPDWNIWRGPIPGGESIEQVAVRARRVIAEACAHEGVVALFAHGHVLRVLTACWLEVSPDNGRLFGLSTGTLSVLGYEHTTKVITRWNQAP